MLILGSIWWWFIVVVRSVYLYNKVRLSYLANLNCVRLLSCTVNNLGLGRLTNYF